MKKSTPKAGDTWYSTAFQAVFVIDYITETKEEYHIVYRQLNFLHKDSETKTKLPKTWFHAYCRKEQSIECNCGNTVFTLHGHKATAEAKTVDANGYALNSLEKRVSHLQCTNCQEHFVRTDVDGYESEMVKVTAEAAASKVDVVWISKAVLENYTDKAIPLAAPRTKPNLSHLMKSSISCPNCSEDDNKVLMSKSESSETYVCPSCGYQETR